MRKHTRIGLMIAGIALAVLIAGGQAIASEVSQGKCIRFDETAKQITIEAYDLQFTKAFPYGQPTGSSEVFDVSRATIGIHPEPGDILRLSWINKNDGRSAMRVMNVTKQDLMKK